MIRISDSFFLQDSVSRVRRAAPDTLVAIRAGEVRVPVALCVLFLLIQGLCPAFHVLGYLLRHFHFVLLAVLLLAVVLLFRRLLSRTGGRRGRGLIANGTHGIGTTRRRRNCGNARSPLRRGRGSLPIRVQNRHKLCAIASTGEIGALPWLVGTRTIRRPNKETAACGCCSNIGNSGRNTIPCWDRNSSRTTRRNDTC